MGGLSSAAPPSAAANPELGAGCCSRLLMLYLYPFLWMGSRSPLVARDLGGVLEEDSAQGIFEAFRGHWLREVSRRASSPAASSLPPPPPPSILRALRRSLGWTWLAAIGAFFVGTGVSFVPPLLLRRIVQHLGGRRPSSAAELAASMAGMLLLPLLSTALISWHNNVMARVGTAMRTALTSAIYAKSLVLRMGAHGGAGGGAGEGGGGKDGAGAGGWTLGAVLTRMSVDAALPLRFVTFAASVLVAPPAIALCLYLVSTFLGDAAVYAGLGFLLLAVPASALLVRSLYGLRRAALALADRRVKLTSEALAGVRAVKANGWEVPLVARVSAVREEELGFVWRAALAMQVNLSLLLMSLPVLLPPIVLSVHSAMGGRLATEDAFAALALLSLLRTPIAFLPMGVTMWLQFNVSLQRIQALLLAPEIETLQRLGGAGSGGDDDGDGWLGATAQQRKEEGGHVSAVAVAPEGAAPRDRRGATEEGNADESLVMCECEGLTVRWGDVVNSPSRSEGGIAATTVAAPATAIPVYLTQATIAPMTFGGSSTATTMVAPAVGSDAFAIGSPPFLSSTTSPSQSTLYSSTTTAPVASHLVVGGDPAPEVPRTAPLPPVRTADLSGVSLRLRAGELLAVVGPVASGKSTLLQALLGEAPVLEGRVRRRGHVAFAAQQPWIVHDTLRGNIIFGAPFDEERYNAVLDACALRPDIELLRDGDLTEIGENGVTLSGGQKARVSLARAAYAIAASAPAAPPPVVAAAAPLPPPSSSDGFLPVCAVFMDDPLAAVDAHVGEHLFRRCITGILAGTARILVTNALYVLPVVDRILVLSAQGGVAALGTFAEINAAHPGLLESLAATAEGGGSTAASSGSQEASATGATGAKLEEDRGLQAAPLSPSSEPAARRCDDADECAAAGVGRNATATTDVAPSALVPSFATPTHASLAPLEAATTPKIARRGPGVSVMTVEERSTGSVSLSIIFDFIAAQGVGITVAIALLSIACKSLEVAGTFWLGDWSATHGHFSAMYNGSSSSNTSFFPGPPPPPHILAVNGSSLPPCTLSARGARKHGCLDSAHARVPLDAYFLAIYVALNMASVLLTTVRGVFFAVARVNAARALHASLLWRVVTAPVYWFDATPHGRIMNRFSREISVIDTELPMSVSQYVNYAFGVVGSLLTSVVATRGLLLAPLLPMALLYRALQRFYMASSTELQRLESVSRSPLFSSFTTLLSGAATVRAYGAGARHLAHALATIDANTVPYLLGQLCANLLGQWLDAFSALLGFLVALFVVLAGPALVSPAWAAIALAASLELAGSLKAAVRMAAQVEAQMTSVQRVLHYAKEVPQEAGAAGTTFDSVREALQENAAAGRRGAIWTTSTHDGKAVAAAAAAAASAQELAVAALPPAWPERGDILVKDLRLRYKTLGATASAVEQSSLLSTPALASSEEGLSIRSYSGSSSGGNSPVGTYKGATASVAVKVVDANSSIGSSSSSCDSVGSSSLGSATASRGSLSWARRFLRRPTILRSRVGGASFELGPEVLCGVSFHVPAGSKLGIVGRTGSGKSSIAAALLRLAEPCGGSIAIDGVDTARVPLSLLRNRLSIIPQEPVLFSTTLRRNVDPFCEHGDEAVREALRRVRLGAHALDGDVSEGGSNMSVGERQLVCIARCFLRRTPIVILDEATASIDAATDAIMQSAMRELFAHCTVITIAHRLETVADADAVIVLDAGVVVEEGAPAMLLKKPAGAFRALVDRLGPAAAAKVHAIAAAATNAKAALADSGAI